MSRLVEHKTMHNLLVHACHVMARGLCILPRLEIFQKCKHMRESLLSLLTDLSVMLYY